MHTPGREWATTDRCLRFTSLKLHSKAQAEYNAAGAPCAATRMRVSLAHRTALTDRQTYASEFRACMGARPMKPWRPKIDKPGRPQAASTNRHALGLQGIISPRP